MAFWLEYFQALNHTVRHRRNTLSPPARSTSRLISISASRTVRISDVFPLPQAPLIAMVSGVWLARSAMILANVSA